MKRGSWIEREGINNTTYSTYSLEDLGKIVDGGGIHRGRKRKKNILDGMGRDIGGAPVYRHSYPAGTGN